MQEIFKQNLDDYSIADAAFTITRTIRKNDEKFPLLFLIGALKIAQRFPYNIVNSDDCSGNVKINIKLFLKGFSNAERHDLFRELEEHNNTVKNEEPSQILYKEITKYVTDRDSLETITEIIMTVRGYREIHPAQVRIVFS